MDRDKKIKSDEVPHKGYDFPKNEIPDELDYVDEGEHNEQGASIFDYLKYGWDKLKGFVIGAVKLVSDIKTISIQANTLLYLAIALIIFIIILKLIL